VLVSRLPSALHSLLRACVVGASFLRSFVSIAVRAHIGMRSLRGFSHHSHHHKQSHPPSVSYDRLVAEGLVRDDSRQRNALVTLDQFWKDMQAPVVKRGVFSSLFGAMRKEEEVVQPNNIYLHGSVGTGKSMLMDLLYDSIPGKEKSRVHFHEFMLDVRKNILFVVGLFNVCRKGASQNSSLAAV
jgi:predicted ATPase